MKKFILLFLLTAITGAGIAQKTYSDANAVKRSVSSFHGIDVETGITLILTEGAAEEVAVSAAKDEYRDKIITEVKDGILKIHYDTKLGSVNRKNETKSLKAYVSYKSIDHLYATTGAEVEINGLLKSSNLQMKANTGARINGQIDIADITLNQGTGSKVTLSGKADKLTIEGNTGSKFYGEDLSTSNCSIAVSTGAVVTVRAEKQLQVKANTGGNVKYKGAASILEIKTGTGGTVTKI